MKSTAIVSSVTTSESRQCTGLRCATVPSAEITTSAARKMNTPGDISVRPRSQHHDHRGDHDIGEAERYASLPSQPHHLVVAKARQRPANQNLQPAEQDGLDHERNQAEDRDQQLRQPEMGAARKVKAVAIEPRHLPSAEKEHR